MSVDNPSDFKRECLRRAIAVVTAGLDDDFDAVVETAQSYMKEDPFHEYAEMVGLHSLATILLIRLEGATGQSSAEILQEIARKVAT
jgi:hypothetical protein